MKPNFKLSHNHDVAAAITRIYKYINAIESNSAAQTKQSINTQPKVAKKPTLRLVK